MELSGIDTKKYSTYLTRKQYHQKQNPWQCRLKTKPTGWKSEKTFAQYYDKPVEEELDIHIQQRYKYCNEHIVLKIYC